MRRAARIPYLWLLLCAALNSALPSDPAPLAGPSLASNFRLILSDGREGVLAGVQIPGCGADHAEASQWCQAALAAANNFLQRQDLVLHTRGIDRWRRPLVVPQAPCGEELQTSLLRQGLALLDPLTAPALDLNRWQLAERAARAAKRGLWGDGGLVPLAAAEVAPTPIRFRLVCGTVKRAVATRHGLYLDFGPNRHRALSVRVAPEVTRTAGFRPARALIGQRLCVRGWIGEAGRPVVEVIEPAQLEPLP